MAGVPGNADIVNVKVPSPMLGFALALGAGLLVGIMFAAVTVYVCANQVLCGLALTLMGTGLSAVIGKAYSGVTDAEIAQRIALDPHLEADAAGSNGR